MNIVPVPTPEQIEHANELMAWLVEEGYPECDMIGVMHYLILERDYDDREVLSWLPAEVFNEVVAWLQAFARERELEGE